MFNYHLQICKLHLAKNVATQGPDSHTSVFPEEHDDANYHMQICKLHLAKNVATQWPDSHNYVFPEEHDDANM